MINSEKFNASTTNWIGLWTLFSKETTRFLKVFYQTVLAPVVTNILFLTVFLIVIDSAEGVDISSYPIKSFKNINKPEFKELKNLIAENYPKSNCQSFENGYIETVYLNDKYKWDKDYLNKLVYKSQKARERVAKHLKENYEKEKNSSTLQKIKAEFNNSITFYRVKNKR